MMSSLTMILTIDSTNEFCCKQCLDSIFRQTKNNFELVLLQDEKATFQWIQFLIVMKNQLE